MAKDYDYDEAVDFGLNRADLIKLHDEVVENIPTQLLRFDFVGRKPYRKIKIWFNSNLPAGEKTTLDGLVSSHDYKSSLNTKRVLLGDASLYPYPGVASNNEIQYTQIELKKNERINDLETYVAEITNLGGKVKLGLYSQANSLDSQQLPKTLVANTSEYTIQSADEDNYVKISTTAQYVVPEDGYYYLAFITDSTKIKWATSLSRKNLLPLVWEDSTGLTLPSTASASKKSGGAVCVAAVVEIE